MAVIVRKARMSDKKELMSFIKNVWGGHDYIPRVWDEWLADDSGVMFVVEVDGVPVGMNRVRFMGDGSAWFEGARVHPSYRGRGLATLLGENSIKVALARGVTTYRLTSNSRNVKAHRQVARMGFIEVSRVSVYEQRKVSRFARMVEARRAGKGDVGEVARAVQDSKEFRLGGGVMWDGFTVLSLTRDVIAKLVEDGSVFLFEGAIAFVRPGREGREAWNQVGFVTGDVQSATKLVKHLLVGKKKFDWRIVYVPQRSPLIGAFRRAGLKRAFSLVLFERKAPNG